MDKTEIGERLVPIPLPDPSFDNPLPLVLAKDGTIVLSYNAFMRRDVNIIVSFHTAFGHRFGPPGRAGLASHPYAGRGLKADAAFEVKNSSWIRDAFGGKGKHYLFAFKDAMFECAAEGYGSEKIDEDDDAIRLMSRRLYM